MHPCESDREHSTGEIEEPKASKDCDECEHPIAAHHQEYGCQVVIAEEGTAYRGPCGCTAWEREEWPCASVPLVDEEFEVRAK
jgi:hypothetical protein